MPFISSADTPFAALQAVGGELTGTLGSNSLTGHSLSLTYSACIPLKPFNLAGTPQHTAIKLFTLPLGVRSWRALAQRTYTFPSQPPEYLMADGEAYPAGDYAPGAIRLLDEYLPLYGTRLTFGALGSAGILATVEVLLDLEKIRYPRTPVTLTTTLALGGVQVVGDVALIKKPDLAQAQALAASWLDLADYTPRVVDNIVTYYLS